jgi:hypothetical protein
MKRHHGETHGAFEYKRGEQKTTTSIAKKPKKRQFSRSILYLVDAANANDGIRGVG